MNNLRDKEPWQLTKAEFQEHGATMFDVYGQPCWVIHWHDMTKEQRMGVLIKYIVETGDTDMEECGWKDFGFDVDTLSCVGDDWVLHEKEVELALKEGLPVPEEVLADYPHLKKENR